MVLAPVQFRDRSRGAKLGSFLHQGEDPVNRGLAASLAKVYCSAAYSRIAGDGSQVHGGIGFTWEHPAHLYFRSAKASEAMFGTPG